MIEHGGADEFSPIICSLFADGGRLPMVANAELIVACVNACEGWEDPAEARRLLEVQAVELAGVRAQNVVLREALQKCQNAMDPDQSWSAFLCVKTREQARAALPATEGSKP